MNEAAIRRVLTSRSGGVARALSRKAVAVESAWKQIATAEGLVDTGRYRASIAWRLGQDGFGPYAEIGTAVPYAGVIEEGSKPHIIIPNRKKALYWKGAAHPVRAVHHPGTRPHHVGKRALRIGARA